MISEASNAIQDWIAFIVPGLHLQWPLALMLLPAPLLWPIFIRSRFRHERIQAGDGIELPPSLALALSHPDTASAQHDIARLILPVLAWLCLITALAQPVRPGDAVISPASGRAMVLAIDLSGSMEREDFTLDGVAADRLTIVQSVAQDFITRRQGDRLGLVVFGKDAYIASPLTFDLNGLADSLAGVGIGMAGRSTAIGDALGLSLSMLRKDSASSKAIILLSDGTNNAGTVEPEAAASLAREFGVRVHTIALASEHTITRGYATSPSADLDEATLKAVAEAAGGEYFRARTTAELTRMYAAIDQLESSAEDAPPTRPTDDLRVWPLIALFLTTLAMAISQRAT